MLYYSRSTVPIHERLSAEAEQLRAEAARREAVKIENELKGATFAPEIPVVSTVLARKKTEEALLAAEAQEANELEAAALVITPENSPKKNGISQGKSAGSSSPTAALAAEFDLSLVTLRASMRRPRHPSLRPRMNKPRGSPILSVGSEGQL